ncbi:MAG: response regulator [Candidatus Cloacimonetes bacterium]|nr:response regulator [Candidatus Cloacimonadota bacterium]
MATILVIEDHDELRRMLDSALRSSGLHVIQAENGVQGLRVLEVMPVDLVLTDVLMPDMDGIEVVSALRKSHPGLPVIAMSGGGQWMEVADFQHVLQRLGVAAVFHKPISISTLLTVIHQILQIR